MFYGMLGLSFYNFSIITFERPGRKNSETCWLTTGMEKCKTNPYLHPFFIGLFPALFLMAYNMKEFPFIEGFRSFLVIVLGVITLLYFLSMLLKDKAKASLVTSFTTISFFFYGHISRN